MKVRAEKLRTSTRIDVERLAEILDRLTSIWGSTEGTQDEFLYTGVEVGARRIPGRRGRSTVEIIRKNPDPRKDSESVRFNFDSRGRVRSFEENSGSENIGRVVMDNLFPVRIKTHVERAETAVDMARSAGLMAVDQSIAA